MAHCINLCLEIDRYATMFAPHLATSTDLKIATEICSTLRGNCAPVSNVFYGFGAAAGLGLGAFSG